jgi:hypothetical protein
MGRVARHLEHHVAFEQFHRVTFGEDPSLNQPVIFIDGEPTQGLIPSPGRTGYWRTGHVIILRESEYFLTRPEVSRSVKVSVSE